MPAAGIRPLRVERPCPTLCRMPHEAPRSTLPAVAVVAADRRVRESVASLLAASGQVRLLGTAGGPDEAVRLAHGADPGVVVVARDMAGNGKGTALLQQLRQEAPTARILVIEWDGPATSFDGPGVDAVLDLADQPSALLEAILAPELPAAVAPAD